MAAYIQEDPQAKREWAQYQKVKSLYATRDEAYAKLKRLLGGFFYSNDVITTQELTPSQVREVQQTTGSSLVINRLAVVVKNYKSFLSQPPEIDVPPRKNKSGIAEKAAEQHADTLEKLLYATWSANKMELQLQGIAHYTSGLGSSPVQLWPNIDQRLIRYNVLRPWAFYPMTSPRDFQKFRYVCVEHPMSGEEIKAEYPTALKLFNDGLNVILEDDRFYIVVEHFTEDTHSVIVGRYGGEGPASPYVTDEEPLTVTGPQTIYRVKNKLAFVPFINIPGNYIPHQSMGESDIEQSVGLNYYVNEMFNNQADIMAFTANPILVVFGSSIPTEKIPNHPGAALSIPEAGAKAQFLYPPNVGGDYFQQMDRVMRYIEEATSQPETVMGRVQPSVESGAAIQALMGGMAAQVATKQRTFKVFFEELNAMTLQAYERVFGEAKISLHGVTGLYSGEHFAVELKGSDIDGWWANEVIYREGMMDFGSRLVNTLQMQGSGLISRRTARRLVGVRSPLEEEAQIRAERLEDLAFSASAQPDRGQGDIQRQRQGLQRGRIPGQGGQGGLPTPEQMAGLLTAAQGGGGPESLPAGAPAPVVPPPSGPAPDEAAVKRALGRVSFVGKAYLVSVDASGISVIVTRESDKAKVEEALAQFGVPVNVQVSAEKPEGATRIRGSR